MSEQERTEGLREALATLVFLLDREREGIVAPKNRSSWVPWTPSIDKAMKAARRAIAKAESC